MKLLHVYGNMYQMGLAHGALLKDDLNAFLHELWDYIEGQVEDALPKKLPKFLKRDASNFALGTVLDLNYEITLPYTNKKYYEEMRGIADGSGVELKYFRRIHMIGELTKGACSMFGAWGKATSHGQTIQLRALDWVHFDLFRMLTDPSENTPWASSTTLTTKNTEIPGSTSVSLDGSVSSQV